jgi:hypothetical protein
MSDDLLPDIENLIALLKVHKESLQWRKLQEAKQGPLDQTQPNFHALLEAQKAIATAQWELARLTLLPLLSPINIATLRRMYMDAFEPVPPPTPLHVLGDASAILKTLFIDTCDRSVAERFLTLFMHDYPLLRPIITNHLRQYGTYLDMHLGTNYDPIPPSISRQNDTVLLIALEPDPRMPEQFHLRAWLWYAPDNIKPIANDDSYTSSLVALKERIIAIYNIATELPMVDFSRLTLEFFLPTVFLDQPIHLWSVDIAENFPSALSFEHPVHVRFYERTFIRSRHAKRARDIWKNKWKRINQTTIDQIKKLYTAQHLADKTKFYRLLDNGMCYVELCGVPAHNQARDVLERAGIGVGLWLAEGDEGVDYDFSSLDAFVNKMSLDHFFPSKMYAIRKHEAWAEPIVVLWDDPERRPEDADDPNTTLISME